jgi:hypothetical protein
MVEGEKAPTEAHRFGVEEAENVAAVMERRGATANQAGAQTKLVRNVSVPRGFWPKCGSFWVNLIQAELFAALQETKINKWSKESLHLYREPTSWQGAYRKTSGGC